MFTSALKSLLGSGRKREAKKLQPLVTEIYEEFQPLSDEELRAKTDEFRERIAEVTAELKGQIESLREDRRHSQDASERERLSMEIGGHEKVLLAVLEDTLEDLLYEAIAVVKDACRRLMGRGREVVVTGQTLTWDTIPCDVRFIGGIALHRGKAAEMATGEGKTLVTTMPLS